MLYLVSNCLLHVWCASAVGADSAERFVWTLGWAVLTDGLWGEKTDRGVLS
jgi:hypothetical protein